MPPLRSDPDVDQEGPTMIEVNNRQRFPALLTVPILAFVVGSALLMYTPGVLAQEPNTEEPTTQEMEPTPTPTYEGSRWELLNGTPVGDGLSALSDLMGVSDVVARFIVAMVLIGCVSVAVVKTPGVLESGAASTIVLIVGYIVLMGCFWIGLVTSAVLGVVTVLAVVAVGFIFFLQRTSA